MKKYILSIVSVILYAFVFASWVYSQDTTTLLSYGAVRDCVFFNTAVALVLYAFMIWRWGKSKYLHTSSWFVFSSVGIGVWNLNGVMGFSFPHSIPLMNILGAAQCWALLFGIVLIYVENFLYRSKEKPAVDCCAVEKNKTVS